MGTNFINSLFTIFILLILGCNSQTQKTANAKNIRNNSISKNNSNVKFYTACDTMSIATEFGDTLTFSKKEYNRIVDNHPEFYAEFAYNPDYVYNCYGEGLDFGSEQGKDAYFVLYAYFLKQKNGVERFAEQRKRLIAIYTNLNALFGHFQYGGAYFGHQRLRILGYAEYSVYLNPEKKKDFEKTYDINKQKQLYIKAIRQLITDESSIDFETLEKERIIRLKKLNNIVDELDSLITDIFYLRRAQAFQYENYEYY